MRTEECCFFSDGLSLAAQFHWPDHGGNEARYPLIIACSGFTGLCCIHPARFARYFTRCGFACFCFDYRGFGASEGTRGRVILEEQVRDIIHGVAFALADPRVDRNRVFLLGWGLGAGLVLDAARAPHDVRGILAVDGFYDARRLQQAPRGAEGWGGPEAEVDEERAQRVRSGVPWRADAFHFYPLNPRSQDYVDNVLREYEDYATAGYSFELADSLMRWQPEAYAPYMSTPLFIAHGDDNRLHPPSEAQSLYRRYAGPKTIYWLNGAGHTEWMFDDDPRFQALCGRMAGWIRAQLAGR